MKKILSLLLALALCGGLGAPAMAAEQFADVPAGHAFHDAAVWAVEQGVAGGYGDGTFRPVNPVTRAQFCVMLARAFYPTDVQRLSTPVYTGQGWFVPSTRALFENGVLENTGFLKAFATADTMGQNISRYDMAQLMTNVMAAGGFAASEVQKTAAQAKIGDYGAIPAQYRDAVKNVFALGIITGYAGGSFGGENPMNRGQGCVVIYRMAQYVPVGGGSKAAQAPAAQPETPKQPETPAQSESGTLTNGKPVTEENVLELLKELESKYPDGSSFAAGYPQGNFSTDVLKATNSYTCRNSNTGMIGKTSTTSGCGGWAALASDYIFGQTGFPARKVSFLDARPGDLVVYLNNDGSAFHFELAISRAKHDDECGFTGFAATGASTPGTSKKEDYTVQWPWDQNAAIVYDDGFLAENTEVWTRYPE